MWLPGKFTPQRSPSGWRHFPVILAVAPASLVEYLLFHGHPVIGAVGLLVWLPLLWLLLVELHEVGRTPIWFSAPLVVALLTVMGLAIAGWLRYGAL